MIRRADHPGGCDYYTDECIARTVGNDCRQEWYGVEKKENRFVCARCGNSGKTVLKASLTSESWGELIYECSCGNYIIQKTFKDFTKE